MIITPAVVEIVKAVQAKVGVTADGIAGPATWSAICQALHTPVFLAIYDKICAVQRILGCTIDGIDGPATWAAISRALIVSVPQEHLDHADLASSNNRSFAYWQSFFASKAPEFSAFHLKQVAVRGWLEGTSRENRTDIYDDAIIVLNDGQINIYRAAVDPSSYLIRNPINSDGAAQLTPGLWKFRRGLHHGNPNLTCFIQAEDFLFNRLDRAGKVTHQERGDVGCHEHSGGSPDTTDRYTAGCQVVWNPDGYNNGHGEWGRFWYVNFYYPQVKTMQANEQDIVPYLLTNAEDLPKAA